MWVLQNCFTPSVSKTEPFTVAYFIKFDNAIKAQLFGSTLLSLYHVLFLVMCRINPYGIDKENIMS